MFPSLYSNAARDKWVVGRVLEVYPGSDGQVHNAKVKTATGEYNLPVTGLLSSTLQRDTMNERTALGIRTTPLLGRRMFR